jgi:hypothetical protein
MKMPTWKQMRAATIDAIDPLSKVAQIAAVVIAGIWAYRTHVLSGEEDLVPEVWVSAQVAAYSQVARLLVVHIRERNVGKVPLELKPDAMILTVKRVPDSHAPGYINMDKQPVLFEEKRLLGGEDGPYISPGAEQEDVVAFVVAPGTYGIEAKFSLSDGDTASHNAFQKVD